MTLVSGSSWGRYPRVQQRVVPVLDREDGLPLPDHGSVLPHGNGRSYGDSCLNPDGTLLASRALDRFIAFDPATGIVRCEAGATLANIIDIALPSGWFLPVTPGTRYATVGGAIGNDVHGKNHHRAGTFGHHIRRLQLLRSDGTRLELAPGDASGLFEATVGGLGLTGSSPGPNCSCDASPAPGSRPNRSASTTSMSSSACRGSPPAASSTPWPGSTALPVASIWAAGISCAATMRRAMHRPLPPARRHAAACRWYRPYHWSTA